MGGRCLGYPPFAALGASGVGVSGSPSLHVVGASRRVPPLAALGASDVACCCCVRRAAVAGSASCPATCGFGGLGRGVRVGVCGFASRHSRSWGPQRCRSPADGHSRVARAGVACLHARDMHSSGTKRLRDCRVRFTPGVARLHSRALRSGCLLGRASHPAESAGGLILFPRVARLSGQGGGLCIPGNWWPSPGA